MKIKLVITFIFQVSFFLSCIEGDVRNSSSAKKIRICFWNVKNLSLEGLQRPNKGVYVMKFATICDVISFMEIRSADLDMAGAFEEEFRKNDKEYSCIEGDPKGEHIRKEKYVTCVRGFITGFEKIEYGDEESIFSRPPTLFVFEIGYKKVLLVPFHSKPGVKKELEGFQKVIDFVFRKFSDRRAFFGGDFNTGENYQSSGFLNSLSYFHILKQLVKEPTTFAGQHHDLIFTDSRTGSGCVGKVHRLDELFPDLKEEEYWEKISDHFPVSAECYF
ncbi:MAG: hypothetical protein K8R21_11435 [Leptospira sp.]|nr:hypothetical protein [Leptospira sp.]